MGLNKHEGGTFLSISEGKIVRRHETEVKGKTVSRVNKLGKTVHEEKFDDIEGIISSLKLKADTSGQGYGDQYVIQITDGSDVYNINVQQSSRYATAFLKCLPNVDLSKPVRLMPWSMQDKNNASKNITGITMWQDGVKIQPAYTKEDPNGLPEMKKVKLKGKDTWDSYEMDEFLKVMALRLFESKAEKTPAMAGDNVQTPF
jgi:hypothetical protein